MIKKTKIVIVSGYFNPIHKGHIDYLREARKLGDELWVIVNNDDQVKLKGSVPFMSQKERVLIVKSIRYVDKVFLSLDVKRSVSLSLFFVATGAKLFNREYIFANGGDRTSKNTPESEVCKRKGIKMVFNVGGKKRQSSSTLIAKAKKHGKK